MEEKLEKKATSRKKKQSFETSNEIKVLGYMVVIVDKYLEDSISHIFSLYVWLSLLNIYQQLQPYNLKL